MIFNVVVPFLVLIFMAGTLGAEPVAKELPIFVGEDNKIREQKPGETFPLLDEALSELKLKYGISFDEKYFKGYIVHHNNENDEPFSMMASDPLIKSFVGMSPYTLFTEKEKTIQELNDLYFENYNIPFELHGTCAIDYINMMYVEFNKTDRIYRNDNETITSSLVEALLHETLHFYHYNNPEQIWDLLHTAGSFYDKVEATKKICENYMDARSSINYPEDPKCEGYSNEEVTRKILIDIKWPSRFGPSVSRQVLHENSTGDKKSQIQYKGKIYFEYSNPLLNWDAHAFDDEDGLEYFAILMQLFVFSPDDFYNIATEKEQEFAKNLFQNEFGRKHHSNI